MSEFLPLKQCHPIPGLAEARQAINELEADAQAAEAAALRAIAVREVLRETTQQLKEEFNIVGLLKPLRELPPLIKAQRLAVASAQAVLAEAIESLKVAEANIDMAVANEINDNGKPRFSNAETRAAEARTRRQFDADYQAALEFLQGTNQLVAERQAELDLLLNQFEAAKIAANLTAAQLAALQR